MIRLSSRARLALSLLLLPLLAACAGAYVSTGASTYDRNATGSVSLSLPGYGSVNVYGGSNRRISVSTSGSVRSH